jgi:peptide/nickel transport system permease protein
MPVGRFLLYRAARALLALWLVVTAAFVLLRASGDPTRLLLSDDATPDQVNALRAQLGLDQPLPVQYIRYIGQIARGDFRPSLREHQPAVEIVGTRVPATLELAATAFLVATAAGLMLGTFAALQRGRAGDVLTMAAVTGLQAVPAFFVGIVLILIVSIHLGWLPSSGSGSVQQLVLPAITLALFPLASIARLTRSSLLEVLPREFVRTAHAKGLGARQILLGHTARNAALPVITLLGLELGALVTGSVIVETVFAWPGISRLAIESIAVRDYPVVQAVVLMMAAFFVAVNFLVDSSYALLDPRVAHG